MRAAFDVTKPGKKNSFGALCGRAALPDSNFVANGVEGRGLSIVAHPMASIVYWSPRAASIALVMSADIQQRVNKARQLLLSNRFTQALPLYQRLLSQRPSDAVLWFEYGNAASAVNQAMVAEKAWSRAIELAPNNAELIGLIGHQYQGLRKPEQAKACFARAAAADPRGINPRISMAVLAEQNHRLEEARRAVRECLAIDSRDDQARYFGAVLDRRENKLKQAERALRDLLASEPKHPFVRYATRYELASVLDRTGRYDEAMVLLLEAKNIVRSLTDTE